MISPLCTAHPPLYCTPLPVYCTGIMQGEYYEAREEMNDWLEKDDVPAATKTTMYAHQLQRVNQLKNQDFRPEPSPVQMITQTQ